jgi:hypothetical protein
MRGEIDNFTRGSQLLSHKFLMFKSGFGLLMLLHLGLTALTAILFVAYNSTEHERYLAMMRGEALGWQWMELDPTKAMWIETAKGAKITLTWAQAVTHPVLQRGCDGPAVVRDCLWQFCRWHPCCHRLVCLKAYWPLRTSGQRTARCASDLPQAAHQGTQSP